MPVRLVLRSVEQPEPGVDLLFYSPDQTRARKLAARLQSLATVHWESLRDALAILPAPRPDGGRTVLLDFAPDAAADATELARRLLTHAPQLPLVGVGATGGGQTAGVLAALRAGVRDFLDPDTPDEEIRQLLTRVQAAALQTGACAPAPAPAAQGRVVLLLGVRPGVGTSTLAAHLGALAMSADAGDERRSALLLDLGRPAGDAALYLGVERDFHYDDALRGAQRIDATLIRTAFGQHASRLAVLSQAPDTLEPPRGEDAAGVLVERLRSHFDLLLCDLGGLPVPQIPPALLHAATEIWLLADQGIGTMVSLDAALRELEQRGVRDQRLSLLLNRYDEDGGMEAGQIARRFGLPLLAVLPERSRALRVSASQGLLLQQVSPRDPYLRHLNPLLERLQSGAAPAGAARRPHWLARLGGIRWKSK